MKIKTLQKDIEATNAVKAFRQKAGSSQKPRNHFNWWQAFFAILCYGENTCLNAREEIEQKTGMRFELFFANYVRMAVDGQLPNPQRREYTKSLLGVATAIGLEYERFNQGLGRPSFVFFVKNRRVARARLIKRFPAMESLFTLLDRKS